MQTHPARVEADLVAETVRAAVVTVLEVDPGRVGPQSSLTDLGADSLALVEVAEIVEERLAAHSATRLHIPDDDLEAMRTVGDVVDYALARL